VYDVDDAGDMIHIRHSWSEIDKLKSIKNTDTRNILLRRELYDNFYMDRNPEKGIYWVEKNDISND
jgi:hypothetical protein